MIALTTCRCNDLNREAERLGIISSAFGVEASADFEGIGIAERNIRYRGRLNYIASADAVAKLIRETDAAVKVHNTPRAGVDVEQEQRDGPPRANTFWLSVTVSVPHTFPRILLRTRVAQPSRHSALTS